MDTVYDDLPFKEQMQRELNHRIAQHLVDEAAQFGPTYLMAMLSAVNGRWDDIMKDIRRHRITTDQAIMITDALEGARLISESVGIAKREQILSKPHFPTD